MKRKIAVLLFLVLLTVTPACAHMSNQKHDPKINQPKVGAQDYHPGLKNILLSYLLEIGVNMYFKR